MQSNATPRAHETDEERWECRQPPTDLRPWRTPRRSRPDLDDWLEHPAPVFIAARKALEALVEPPPSRFTMLVASLKRALLRRRVEERLPKAFLTDLSGTLEEASSRLTSLGDDFDGEGSKGYSEEVVQRAGDFVRSQAVELWDRQRVLLELPDLGAGREGSVDVHWRTAKCELLVNIPASRLMPASFYGDNYDRLKVRGTIDIGKPNLGLLGWLSER